jgi:molybdate-binding protein
VLSVLTLARWEVGLVTRVEDTNRIRGASDLGLRRVRLITREPDAATQQLLERELRATGVPQPPRRKHSLRASSHLAVARAVAMNAADAGVATRDAALAFGLHFVPWCEERFDLVLSKALLSDPRIERFFDALVSQEARTELDALGYDVSQAGAHVADVRAE